MAKPKAAVVLCLLLSLSLLLGVALYWDQLARSYWARRALAASETNLEMAIVPGHGVGKIEFGMSRSEVESLLGRPQMSMGPHAAEYLTLGLAVIYDTESRVHSVFGGGPVLDSPLVAAFKGRVGNGVVMRCSVMEVEAELGPPSRVRTELDTELWEYSKLGLQLVFERGFLRHVSASRLLPAA